MKQSDYRVFRAGFPHHVYTKAKDGFVIFYSLEDCIFYFTLFSSSVHKYGIEVLAFEIMPNHIHSSERTRCLDDLRMFHSELESKFVYGYNREHNRQGPLFMSPFGYAPKVVAKRIKDSICYIANNTVAGKMKESVLKSRWNMLAYYNNDHPFSEKIIIRNSSWKMKQAVKLVKYYGKRMLPLDYQRQRQIFEGLSPKEKDQILDLIITTYNFVNYKSMTAYFSGSMEGATLVMESNSGSESDIPDDFEDYGKYLTMMKMCGEMGIDLKTVNFELLSEDEKRGMVRFLRPSGARINQIYKFLHIRNQYRD